MISVLRGCTCLPLPPATSKFSNMRSTVGHEMQKYTSLLTPNLAESKATKDKCSSSSNRRNEKYGLRERQKRRHVLANMVDLQRHQNDKNDADIITNSSTKSCSSNASKMKAPPLSKYRRKTANARERTRMREINSAFENLRHCVPQAIAGEDTGVTNEKLTKITTLRLAMKYIRLLSELIKNPNYKTDFPLECLEQAECGFVKQKAKLDVEPPPLAHKRQLPKITKPTTKSSNGNAVRKAPKRLSKKRKPAQNVPSERITTVVTSTESCSSTASNCTYSTLTSNSDSSAAQLLSGVVSGSYSSNNLFQSMTELSGLILESDGESMHLSEHCLSPIQDKYAHLFSSSDSNPTDDISCVKGTGGDLNALESPLELNLQLMDSSPSSLDFSMEQPPTACISPLIALESFSPFGDFLPDYPEQASLDLFLT